MDKTHTAQDAGGDGAAMPGKKNVILVKLFRITRRGFSRNRYYKGMKMLNSKVFAIQPKPRAAATQNVTRRNAKAGSVTRQEVAALFHRDFARMNQTIARQARV